jgi:CDP-diglyceride synthetase
MLMKNNQKWIVLGLLFASLAYASLEVVAALKDQATSGETNLIWSVSFALIVALWTSNDAKDKKLYKPYEYSYFVFLFWPLVLPYHLAKTRGTDGLLVFMGVVLLYMLPFFSGLVAWAYFT